jgi:dTDP-L-rhamnose 4-epimerase
MTARTCIVTGGAGFIGCGISSGLVQRFDRVIAIDDLRPPTHKVRQRPPVLAGPVELLQLDITLPSTWERVFTRIRPAVIVHLAAETGTGQSLTKMTRHARTNLLGTTAMLDALTRHKIWPERILLASSRAVYGNGAWNDTATGRLVYPGHRSRSRLLRGEWDFPGLEPLPASAAATRPIPISVYGSTKLAQEHILRSWTAGYGTVPLVLRLQNVYGPGQSLNNPYTGIVALFCRLARSGRSIPLYEDGRMLRDFVLIDDVAAALLGALDAREVGSDAYDVGTGQAVTVAEVAGWIASMYDAPAPHVCARFRFGDVRHASCTIEATRTALAWRPEIAVRRGLARVKDWIETEFKWERDSRSLIRG